MGGTVDAAAEPVPRPVSFLRWSGDQAISNPLLASKLMSATLRFSLLACSLRRWLLIETPYPLAAWAKPDAGVIVISTALKRGCQRRLISRAMSMGRIRVTAVSLFKAGAQSGLSATGGRGDTDGLIKIGVAGANSQSFWCAGPPPLRNARPCSIYNRSSFGRTTWPCRAIRVGLTTFLQISKIDRAARPCSLPKHAPERRVI